MKEEKNEKNKTLENIKKFKISFSNEIKLLRRTLDNNTHEVYEDLKIQKITSWRKSRNKFMKNLIFNILSFGLLHILSLLYPRLYIKIYCNPWPGKECDYFLVENIYGEAILCPIQKKRDRTIKNKSLFDKNDLIDSNIKVEYNNNVKNLKYIFEYKSMKYEYIEKENIICPVYLNLSKMTNEGIINCFSEGLSSKQIVNNLTVIYGKNEYNLNIKLYLVLFFRNQIPFYSITLIVEILEFNFLFNYINLVFKLILVIVLIIMQIIYIKINIINKYKNDFTLDGNQEKIKVKRKYLLKEEEAQSYSVLDNTDILPGDIIYLKQNDQVPCDGVLLEGECIISQSDLTGSLDIFKKIPLKRDNNYFNYKYSNINLLYHGMKIIQTYSKNNHGFITVLCINTGANTFKANQYSNALYFLTKKNEHNGSYNTFNERKRLFVYMFISFFVPGVIGYSVFGSLLAKRDRKNVKSNFLSYIISMLCKSFMTYFFINKNILLYYNAFLLSTKNIICFDLSRLINSGKINKILINKTETLSNNYFTIQGYHPISFVSNKKNLIKFLNYNKTQSKELNLILFDYYKHYSINKTNNSTFKINGSNKLNNNLNNKTEEYVTLFLESLLSCNCVDIYNFELFGNNLDIELFNCMKWDIKQYEENNSVNSLKIKYFKDININNYSLGINNNSKDKYYYVIKKITDIYPNNYYELSESSKLSLYKNKTDISSDTSTLSSKINNLLSSSNIKSYKLRIYKKFIIKEGIVSGAIVHNYITNEIRFMIKGIPEEIIKKCERKSIPINLEQTISFHRKKGFLVLALATKLLNISSYEDNDEDDLDYYMDDVTFCGLLTLENKNKEQLKNAIGQIKKLSNDLMIVSGDNEYNCLSVGYNSGIIEDKNIFVLDNDEKNNNKITIKKICSSYINQIMENEKENDISKITDFDQYSRVRTINKTNNIKTDNIKDLKDGIIYNGNTIANSNKKINEDLFEDEPNVFELKNKKILSQNKRKKTRKNITKENDNNNSEIERIIKNKSINENNISEAPSVNSIRKNNHKNTFNFSKNITNISQDSNINQSLSFMEVYYYNISFDQYADVKNGIFCISGHLFNYLYRNKERKGIRIFLEKLSDKCKIYFNMSSIDKSMLVDYFRNNIKNIVCSIGQCDSDVDSIISANIGINLKNPKNRNTILCHYYSTKNNMICIKEIIETGRILYENIYMLEYISFIYSVIINCYIFCCLMRDKLIINTEFDFLEIEFFVITILSFFGKSNRENIYINQNSKLLTIYYAVISIEIAVGIFISFFIFATNFSGDKLLDLKSLDEEYVSFFFVLASVYIICSIFVFNFASYYKENPFENRFLIIFTLIYLLYISILIFTCSSNLSYDILKITFFTYDDRLIDSFTDFNKIYLALSVITDILMTFIFCYITKIIFRKFLI